ncbi:hypothetical protein GLAREA_06699 [Glarea lozoyensis ATCC 20868]|uniref:Uncharacterized protein n=1 Tax=Glarea lozoyensis (strain ATCC 20868 / MF5171) TaxID=1116229 RepID=S3DNL3_GLAL2|nr:uncharacterized protein GLAREA_06699 [Glarea lozoyensis ATCC 20868]EPE33686.1 hypothetical protein GLAREA_06699 [Glarea lozoyensis ATCC 20868]
MESTIRRDKTKHSKSRLTHACAQKDASHGSSADNSLLLQPFRQGRRLSYEAEAMTLLFKRHLLANTPGFEHCAYIWFESRPELETTGYVLFDSGCKNSNWVSRHIAVACGADIQVLPEPVFFQAANGAPLAASEFVSLNFCNMCGDNPKTYAATFYVHDNPSFCDAVIGQSYMVLHRMTQGVNFGIYSEQQTPEEIHANKTNDAANVAEAGYYGRAREAEKEKDKKKKSDKKKSSHGHGKKGNSKGGSRA